MGIDSCIPLEDAIDRVIRALRKMRIGIVPDEYAIQEMIEELLSEHEIPFVKEYRLAPRNRIDFMTEGGIGIEVKRGKPNRTMVMKQLMRYASFDEVKAVILVVDKNVTIPDTVMGKRCMLFGLNRLWGVALR
jgi:hypothetical protein